MLYFEEVNGVEKTYEVNYEKDIIKELIDRIIEATSYKVVDEDFSCNNIENFESNLKFYNNFRGLLPNGSTKYCGYDLKENIGGKKEYVIYRRVVPKLAKILTGLLSDNDDVVLRSIKKVIDYENDDEMVSIDEKIKDKYEEIGESLDSNDCNNTRTFELLDELKKELKRKESGEYFNTDLLSEYYDETRKLIGMRLIRRKVLEK